MTSLFAELFPPFMYSIQIAGNALTQWLLASITFIILFFILKLLKSWGSSLLKRLAQTTLIHFDDFIAHHVSQIGDWFITAMTLPMASQWLTLSSNVQTIVHKAPLLAIIVQLMIWVKPTVNFLLNQYLQSRPTETGRLQTETMLGPIRLVSLLVLWSLLVLLALQNLGINVTALITGLGIGGIAIALAVQNILGDLFAAFSIVIDKPFITGDFLVIGDFAGNVTHIGLKTTRIKSLSGEELIFANSDLLSSRIKNYRPLVERRINFDIGVVYQTPTQTLETIPTIIQEIIEQNSTLRFERCHLKSFGASSIDFETVYYVLKPDYSVYMDAQQTLNFSILKAFKKAGIEFAYPTQTLFLTQ